MKYVVKWQGHTWQVESTQLLTHAVIVTRVLSSSLTPGATPKPFVHLYKCYQTKRRADREAQFITGLKTTAFVVPVEYVE